MTDVLLLMQLMIKTAQLLTDPETPARIQRAHTAIRRSLDEAREHQTQLHSWENEGGTVQ